MATQVFLLDTVADTHLGTNNVNLIPTAVGWTSRALGLARGSGVVATDATATVAGTTLGVQVKKTDTLQWISPPVSADVTIAGTITVNLWAAESSNSANVAINAVIDVIRANATGTANSNTLVQIAKTARVTEVALSTRAVNNFTVTPTSTVVNRGDRIRVRVFGDDAGTMGTGFTFNAGYNGATAAADGDSYVSFTETFSFESAPGAASISNQPAITAIGNIYGSGGTTEQQAQSFAAPATGTLSSVTLNLTKGVGAPTDNLIIELQSDSGGVPSGSVVGAIATVAASSYTSGNVNYDYPCSISVTASTTYWIVLRRTGARDTTNRVQAAGGTGNTYAGGVPAAMGSGAWVAGTNDLLFNAVVTTSTTVLYLTDDASAVATASVDREAWTSRGAGVQTDVTNTAAGWTAPIQMSDTAGGTVVDWFTRPLTAFTLGGMTQANLRALESNALANATLRCEIARVEGDGTSPTVWGTWNVAPITTDNGELGTTEAARTANVSGDDLAVTDGQRLRIRVYVDDMSSAAMAASQTVTFYYAGTSAAASGDSYVTFPQTLTEYTAPSGDPRPPVGFAMGRDY